MLKNKGNSLCNFVPNSELVKFCHGTSTDSNVVKVRPRAVAVDTRQFITVGVRIRVMKQGDIGADFTGPEGLEPPTPNIWAQGSCRPSGRPFPQIIGPQICVIWRK